MTRLFFTNASLNLIFQAFTALIGIGVMAFLFKALEPEQFVSFSYLSIFVFLLNYTNFGVPLVTTRKLARVLSKEGKIDGKQIQVSFLASFFICLILISILKLFELNTDISIFDSERFYPPLYVLIVFYFISIHIRSVADGIGLFGLSRYVKSYFYISFFMSAALTEYYNFPVYGNSWLLIFCTVMLIPKLLYQIDFRNLMDVRNSVFSTLYEGLPFLQLAILMGIVGYLDRFVLPYYISGAVLASMLLVLDIVSRQTMVGTGIANISLKLFISSEKAQSEIFLRRAFLICVAFIVICLIGAYFVENAILQFVGFEVYQFSTILNFWVGFSLLVFNSIQYQWMIALSLEKTYIKFLCAEILVLLLLMYLLLRIDAVFYLSVLLFFRACVQIFAADFLIERSIKNMFSAQLLFLIIFVVINITFI